MVTNFLALQSLLVVSFLFSVGFLYYCLQFRQKRGVTSLVVMFTGIILWVLSELIQIQLRDPSFAGFGMALRILGIEVTVIGIFFLGLEFTGRKRLLNWKVAALLSVVPLLEVGLALSPSRDLFFETVINESAPWGYEVGVTPIFAAHVVYSYTFVVVSVAMLAVMMLRANSGYQRQLLAMLVAVLVPTVVNASYHLELLPFDLTPVSFFVTAIVLMYATFRLRLLDAIPVARRTVLEEMEDMVVVLDENNDIITTNTAVTKTFGEQPVTGNSINCLFEQDGVDTIVGTDGKHELELTIDGQERSINVNSSQITDYRGNLLARVLVCRDVTEQKRREAELRQREEELELLKDLQSRFLRHNLRNELNVVRANAELLTDMDDPEERDRYQTIIDKTDRILDWSMKARAIERLVETDQIVHRNVTQEIQDMLVDLNEEYPEVAFELEMDDGAWIAAVPQVDRALRNVLDNAAKYNTADDPVVEVEIKVSEESVTVTITDNGPGVEQYEIKTLEDKEESKLKHGTGLGLWLVYWVVEKSNGSLNIESEDGTTVTIEFERGSSPGTDDQNGARSAKSPTD